MKPNRFKQVRDEGRAPIGHMIVDFATRGAAQMLEVAGCDFVLIDLEHSGLDAGDVANMVAWLRGTTVAPFVRVPQIDYHFIARTLDAGALGIMVPNVKTAAQARAIVDAAKYAPLGKRGVALGGALTGYRAVNAGEFLTQANANTTIICQIESVEGLENIEAIATTPGVDVLWVGHFDLSQSMGIPGQFEDERFLNGLRQVVETARRHGLGAGIQPGGPAQAEAWTRLGFNVISHGTDYSVYVDALTRGVARLRDMAAG